MFEVVQYGTWADPGVDPSFRPTLFGEPGIGFSVKTERLWRRRSAGGQPIKSRGTPGLVVALCEVESILHSTRLSLI